uniref:Uncharacterized protein n=1 Tax=Spermophilus dauricus TaxID=99837 RepID=A0A8C9Q079_SPEDA
MLKQQENDQNLQGEKINVCNNSDMAEVKSMFQKVLPNQGQLSGECVITMVLKCSKQHRIQFTIEKCQKKNTRERETEREREREDF